VLVDVDNILYFSHCENITVSDGGAEEEDDDTYFNVMRTVPDSYSTAGAEDSYIYWAKSVSDKIADVRPVRPTVLRTETCTVYTDGDGNSCAFVGGDGIDVSTLTVSPNFEISLFDAAEPVIDTDYTVTYQDGLLTVTIVPEGALDGAASLDLSFKQERAGCVEIYALMNDGTVATETIKSEIARVCNQDTVRPLTDHVTVKDPIYADYNISLTYYVSNDSTKPIAEIEAAVNAAVNQYKTWQCEKLGRGINPSKLESLVMSTGVKRVAITYPVFTQISDGRNNDTPQVARAVSTTIINGGYEDE
jgi:phage-related baseplate assembly protein